MLIIIYAHTCFCFCCGREKQFEEKRSELTLLRYGYLLSYTRGFQKKDHIANINWTTCALTNDLVSSQSSYVGVNVHIPTTSEHTKTIHLNCILAQEAIGPAFLPSPPPP